MNQKLLSKVLATTLAVILTFSNFIMLGVTLSKTYAVVDELEGQITVSNNENVEFDAYFVNEKGNKVHSVKQDISENLKLCLAINVKLGYLKNAKVTIGDSNFEILSDEVNLETVEIATKNEIVLKQINSGTEVILEVPITSISSEYFDLSNLNKINDVTLTGTYVDNSGKQILAQKTINTKIEWKKEIAVEMEQSVKTFIPYETDSTEKTILQTVIKTGLEENALPIKETSIDIQVPIIEKELPEKVIVVANTYGTNNLGEENFSNQNWAYDEQTGKVQIKVTNEPNEENQVAWNKTDKDEYVITYVYAKKIETIKTAQTVSVMINAYGNEINAKNENTLDINVEGKTGNFVNVEINTNTALSKGYMYSKQAKEIQYNKDIKLNIGYTDFIDKVVVEDSVESFVNSKNEKSQATNDTYYKVTSISKESFKRILGEEGYVKIIGKNGEEIATFTKATKADENGNYVYEYQEKINEIKIETSKPVKEGTLEITNQKALMGNTSYTKAQVEDFQKLELKMVTKVECANTIIENVNAEKDITLVAPSTKIEVNVNKPTLSTVVKNENVELRVILKTNEISCDLYKNPVIELILPNYIRELNIKDMNLLFEDELTIKDKTTYVNENGNIVIKITLQGEQTSYYQNEVSKGANLVINTDITLKKLTPTTDELMKVYVTNENVTTYEETENSKSNKGYASAVLTAVAPVGVVTVNEISGYSLKEESVTSISGEEQVGTIETKEDSKTATVTMDVINNYSNPINNIEILGRIPSSDNTNPSTGENLGSNLTTTLVSDIKADGIDENQMTVYYSANGSATKDLKNSNNGWTTDTDNLNEVKSYLIVSNDYEMSTGDVVTFSYDTQIPENLQHDLSTFAIYTTYFNNVREDEASYENVTSPIVGLSTGVGPDLTVEMTTNVENGEIKEGEIITYNINVKNTGKETVNNVTVSANIPENTIYTYIDNTGTEDERLYDNELKDYTGNIESIAVGETKTLSFQVEADELNYNVEELEITTKANVIVKNYDDVFTSNEKKVKLVRGFLKINLSLVQIPEIYPRQVGDEVTYKIEIINVNSIVKENVNITQTLTDGVSFVGASQYGTYNKATNSVEWDLNMIAENAIKILYVTVRADELPQNTYQKTISSKVSAKNNDYEVTSNGLDFNITKGALTITQTSLTPKEVTEGSSIVYNAVIENIGKGIVSGVKITDMMSSGLEFVTAQYSTNGQTITTGKVISLPGLSGGQKLELTITLKAKEIADGKDSQEVQNVIKIEQDGQAEILSNEIVNKVTKKPAVVEDPSTDEVLEGTHSISGLVWADVNKNGIQDEEEKGVENVTVVLVNPENGQIVKDTVTGSNKEQQTNYNGQYKFTNLESGEYMVIFLYDTDKYGITIYKTEGVNDDKNSDVISLEVKISGEKQLAGVSDKLNLLDTDINNIDMGLIGNDKFDLKLDKVITKIIMQVNEETKEYSYNDSKLAKLDLNPKTVNDTSIIVEYKISVTNEGDIAGYVKKIVDYLPEGMKFSSELNPEWYQSSNGNVYNASLSNTLINPGETKEVTLLLTKKMDENNLGLINNTAEIYESYNDLGIQDTDSTPANKVQNEDDMSSADAMIGVKTGEVYVYITITLISIGILAVGIYYIKKKVLSRI